MTTSPGLIFANERNMAGGDTDTIDTGSDNDLYDGEMVFFVVHVTKDMSGPGALTLRPYQSSQATSGFLPIPGTMQFSIPAGSKAGYVFSVSVPDELSKRYVNLRVLPTATITDGNFTAYLSAFPAGTVNAPLKKGQLV